MTRALILVSLLFTATLSAAPYHLELEATPESLFPYLGRFGNVDLDVYQRGVRAKALWLRAFSRNDASAVTVVNPLARMYVDVSVTEIGPILGRLAGDAGKIERDAVPTLGPKMRGTVKGIAATRHRLVYGTDAWLDVWTTEVIAPNPQMKRIVQQVVTGISPGTGAVAAKLPGTPIYVEANFRRFKNVALIKLKKLTFKADDEEDALTLGSLYMRASVLEKLLTK